MADEREGFGTIGTSESAADVNRGSGFGTGEAGSGRGFGAAGEPALGGFDDGGDVGTRSDEFDRTDVRESSTAREQTGSGRGRIADQLQRVGDRIEERARHLEEAGGVQRRAGRVVLRAGEALDSSADYIRNHEVNEMRDDLESAIRERPLLSVGIAVGAGFLLARLMRD